MEVARRAEVAAAALKKMFPEHVRKNVLPDGREIKIADTKYAAVYDTIYEPDIY